MTDQTTGGMTFYERAFGNIPCDTRNLLTTIITKMVTFQNDNASTHDQTASEATLKCSLIFYPRLTELL